MFGFKNKNMLRIKNKTITSFEELKGQYEALKNEVAHLQREKDMKVNRIENNYQARIDSILRAMELLQNEISRAQDYIAPKDTNQNSNEVVVNIEHNPIDDIIPTPANIKKNAKKTNN